MKALIRLSTVMAVIAGLVSLAPLSSRADTLRISKVRFDERSAPTMWIPKEHAWKEGYPQINALISSREDINSQTIVRLYLYDEEKKLIREFKKPTCTQINTKTGWDWGFDAPAKLPKRIEMLVQFQIPEELVEKRWAKAIVVFGNGSEVTAESEPRGSLDDYDFPEKSQVK